MSLPSDYIQNLPTSFHLHFYHLSIIHCLLLPLLMQLCPNRFPCLTRPLTQMSLHLTAPHRPPPQNQISKQKPTWCFKCLVQVILLFNQEPDNGFPSNRITFWVFFQFFFLAAPGVMRDLSSPTREWTRAPCSGRPES